jgi:hypothetical protein
MNSGWKKYLCHTPGNQRDFGSGCLPQNHDEDTTHLSAAGDDSIGRLLSFGASDADTDLSFQLMPRKSTDRENSCRAADADGPSDWRYAIWDMKQNYSHSEKRRYIHCSPRDRLVTSVLFSERIWSASGIC